LKENADPIAVSIPGAMIEICGRVRNIRYLQRNVGVYYI